MRRNGVYCWDLSSVDKLQYVIDHIIWSFIFGANLYIYSVFFGQIAYWERSAARLFLCMLAAGVFGMTVSFKNYRRNRGTLLDIFSGMGLYLVITTMSIQYSFIKGVLVITALFSLLCMVLILWDRSESKYPGVTFWNERIRRILLMFRRNMGLASMIIVIAFPVYFLVIQNVYEDSKKLEADDIPVKEVYGKEYKLRENLDTIAFIRDNESFQALNFEEKCEVVEAVIRCEASYLGLCEFDIVFEDMGVNVLGAYNHRSKELSINTRVLKDGTLKGGSAEDVLNTCLHECRHCYQHLMVELYVEVSPEQRSLLAFRGSDVASWVANMEDYKSSYDSQADYTEYLTQALEMDASRYAYAETTTYYREIDTLLRERKREEKKGQ